MKNFKRSGKIFKIKKLLVIILSFLLIAGSSISVFKAYAKDTNTVTNLSVNIASNINITLNSKSFSWLGLNTEYDASVISVTVIDFNEDDKFTVQIHGLKKGRSNLVLKNPFKTVTYSVNVTQPAESVTINEDIEELQVNQTVQLSQTIYPRDTSNKNVCWISSNPDIASVDNNGIIKGKSRGEVVISCITLSTPAKKDDLKIKVISAPQKISCQDYNLGVGDAVSPNISIYPEQYNAEIKYDIISNNSGSVVIDENIIKCVNVGSATVKASLCNNPDIFCTFKINVFYEAPTERQITLYNELKSFDGYKELNICQKFVRDVYDNSFGVESQAAASALIAGQQWCIKSFDNTNIYDIPLGAVIYADCGEYGHVGYYDGQGNVIHQNDGAKKLPNLKSSLHISMLMGGDGKTVMI